MMILSTLSSQQQQQQCHLGLGFVEIISTFYCLLKNEIINEKVSVGSFFNPFFDLKLFDQIDIN